MEGKTIKPPWEQTSRPGARPAKAAGEYKNRTHPNGETRGKKKKQSATLRSGWPSKF